jgi:hypothetical protein
VVRRFLIVATMLAGAVADLSSQRRSLSDADDRR